MEKGKYIIPTLALVLMSMSYLLLPTQTPTSNMITPDQAKAIGGVCLYKDSLIGGQNQYLFCVHNTVTNIAKNQTRDNRMNRVSGNATWSSLLLTTGATAAAATDTTCEATVFTTNGCSAANGTISEVYESVGNYSVTNKFQASGACASIAKVCLSNHTASTSPLMASAKFATAITLAANENLTVVYYMAET